MEIDIEKITEAVNRIINVLGDDDEVLDTLEKAIPKKPVETLGIFGECTLECPWCGDEIRCNFDEYCSTCGQKFDWGKN